MNFEFWRGRKVFLTGHTGFKGLWLTKWLDMLGAHVTGFSLPPDEYSLHPQAALGGGLRDIFGDVRDAGSLEEAVRLSEPEIVFHLAAQAIVGTAWRNPAETFSTNVMGTVNLLEAIRLEKSRAGKTGVRAILAVTSDKVYENIETTRPYDESDRLGGDEPYAASKAAAELAVQAYRNAYFSSTPGVATARASNVYGGGDLHYDRLIPYLIKSKLSETPAEIRNPGSIRPWQYILDLLEGYLTLAAKLQDSPEFSGCWNFGPPEGELYRVGDIAAMLDGKPAAPRGENTFKEAGLLMLNSEKSGARLGWRPRTSLAAGLAECVEFYKDMTAGRPVQDLMEKNISAYMRLTGGNF